MPELPKISIVTPSYNQGHFLEATIKSILSQNYPNLEYIVIDGGSTDESPKIIEKYREHFAYACSEKDHGQYDALNKGLSRATGEIMAWLNSDDMYFPWTLRAVAEIMTAFPRVEWLTTMQPGWWDWTGMSLGFGKTAGYSKEAFLDGCYLPGVASRNVGWVQQESTFWRRSLWQRCGGAITTEFFMASDFDLWTRFYRQTELYGADVPLAGFRFQEAQKTKHAEYIAQAEMSLSRLREECGWKPESGIVTKARTSAARIPGSRRRVEKSYTGKRIFRTDVNNAKARWDLAEYRF